MPTNDYFSVSIDGVHFSEVSHMLPTISPQHNGPIIEIFDAVIPITSARYVRVKADNMGTCPDWHPGNGDKASLMAGGR